MRILLVTHYYADHGGGVEVVAGEIARRLVRRQIEIVWAASGPKPAHPTPGITYLSMCACNVSERWLGIPYPLWGPLGLIRCVREVFRSDVVHLHDSLYQGNVVASLAARLAGRPVLVTQHIGLVPYRQRLLRGLMSTAVHTVARTVLRAASQVVFYSRSVQDYFDAFVRFRRPAVFVPNGVDMDLFHPLTETERRSVRQELGWTGTEPVMLFVGRFVEKKGLARLRRLAERLPQVRWVMIGWGPDDPARWNLPHVTCLGAIEHEKLARYYQAADLLVLPSVGEGFPLVVQEAMACGTPALISAETAQAVPGVEEVVFVAELDDVSLDAVVRSVLASSELLPRRRQASADFARQHWNWEECVRAYGALFQELTSGR